MNVPVVQHGMKVNLGSGKFPLEGYVNVDLHEEAEFTADVWNMTFGNLEEVRMEHFLEHFGWRETVPLLERVRSWMIPGGVLIVEVPNMARIMQQGAKGDWLRYVYGSQQHDGEFHRAGFTETSLCNRIFDAGFCVRTSEHIASQHPSRRGMACLKVTATA